jgi:GTP:adenosylcobinamide-phosphate guanylyltransferase
VVTTAGVGFTALVLAADRSLNDPVARAASVSCKALAPVGGRPMVLRVLDALGAARHVQARVLCGPPRALVEEHDELRRRIDRGEIRWVEPQATPSLSAQATMADLPPHLPVLLTTADHALLSPAMVDYFCAAAATTGADVVVGLARHEVVSTGCPGTRRTVLRLREGGYCGCNLFAFLTSAGRGTTALWRRVEHDRKRPLRVVAGVLGWVGVLRYGLGRLTLNEGLTRVSRRLGVRAAAVLLPFPEAAVDVDTVDDLNMVRARTGDSAP